MTMRYSTIIALACLLSTGGCTKDAQHDAIKDSTEKSLSDKLLSENAGKILPFEESEHFTSEELKATTAAKDCIEAARRGKFDARYAVVKNNEGWLVTVYYVGGYLPAGSPNFAPGRSAEYQVSSKTWVVQPGEPSL